LLVRQLTPRLPDATPVVLDLALDWRVLAFTLAVTLMTALLFGLAPALRSTDLSASALMKTGSQSIVSGWTRFSLEKLLIIGQVALSLVLVGGAALFVRTFTALATLDPGFTSAGVLSVDVNIQRLDYPEHRRHALYDQIREAMRGTPGVQAIASTVIRMIQGGGWESSIQVDGYTVSSHQDLVIHMNAVSPGYFSTMGIALHAGRDFSDHDTLQAPRVAIVNEAFARKYFPGTHALGRQFFRTGNERSGHGPPIDIVGIVQDTKYENLRDQMPATAYVPLTQSRPGNGLTYLVRAAGDPDALRPALGRAIAGVSRDISYTMTTLDATIDASLTQERLLAMLGGFFGLLALLIAGIGLYGVMWLAMTRRRGEIGIRMALGAAPAAVIRMVLREITIIISLGLIAGLLMALASRRLMATLLFGLSATDVRTWILSIALPAGVAMLAGYLPARRASHADPMAALRE
jgi:predicted permease